MTNAPLLLLQASLLAALLQPILCPSRELITSRQDRASNIDTNNFNSFDNPNNYMDNPTKENPTRNLQRRQQQSPKLQRNHEPTKGLNENDFSNIFVLGKEFGIVKFNITSQGSHSENDAVFKVQRNPEDGKLNVVVNHNLVFQTSTAATSTRRPSPTGDFVFPETLYSKNALCEEGGASYCTKVQNYPLDELDNILSDELSKFETFFGADVEPVNIAIRFSDSEPDEQFLCDSNATTIYPEAAMNKDNKWSLIVNNREKYKQGIRIETCTKEGQPCKVLDSLPNQYKSTCKQTYIYRKLVAIGDNGTIIKDDFKIPACCKCVIKKF